VIVVMRLRHEHDFAGRNFAEGKKIRRDASKRGEQA
jgi:hypothetical protein